MARFRYSDLKEAAVVAADAGLMGIEWDGQAVCRCVGLLLRGEEDSGGCCCVG